MRLAGLDRGAQRATTAPSRCVWPTNSSSVRGRIRAASGRSAAGGAPGAPAARRARRRAVPCAKYAARGPGPLSTVAREWGRIGVLGFGGPPAHVALLRDLTVDRRGWIDAREFEDAFAACSLLPGPALDAAGDLLRAAGRRAGRRARRRARVHPARACSSCLVIAAVALQRRAAGCRRRASARARRPRSSPSSPRPGSEADRPAPRRSSTCSPGARRRALLAGPVRGRRSCCSAGAGRSSARQHACQSTVVARADLARGQGRRALLRRRLRDHPADARRRRRAHGWMSEQAFANAVAYGQITPGPVTHTVALVGYAAGRARRRAASPPRSPSRRSFAFVLLGAPPLRAAARRAPNARAFLDGAGPAAAGAILGAAVPLLRLARAPRGSGSCSPPPRSRCSPRVPPLAVLVGGRDRGPRHYALSHGARRGAAGRDRRGPGQADPLQHGQPARQRARVPGVARGLPGGRRARGRARRRRAGAPEPRRDAARAATGRSLGYLSATSTPCSPTPRTGAPTRGAREIRDGFLYGRGAIDMKNQTAAEAVAAAHLARAGAQVQRRR